MSRTAFAIVCMLSALAVAGCLGGPEAEPFPEPQPTPARISAIKPLADTVLVSAPEHRIAEFMVNRNPNDADHLITAYGDYDSPGGVLNCAFSVSFDGGASWTVSEPVPDFSKPSLQFDGWVDFDEWGGVHATCIEQIGPDAATAEAWPYYFNSADGGLTWSQALHVPTDPPTRSTDKTVLGVGRDGTVYVGVSGLVGMTKDNGTTWYGPQEPTGTVPEAMADIPGGIAALNGFVEGNDGTLFLSGLGEGDDVGVVHTKDQGRTWEYAAAGQFHIPPGYNDQNRWARQEPWTALPTLAYDPVADSVWVSYQSWDTEYGGYKLHLWRSTDNGVTFTQTAVPDFTSPTCADPCHVTHPALAFDANGTVGLIVQLTRDGGHLKEVYFSASDDNGATWLPPFELSKTDGMGPGSQAWTNPNAFQPLAENAGNIATGTEPSPGGVKATAAGIALTTAVSELQIRWNGEYWGLAASSKGFVAMWIDHSNDGRPQLYSRLLSVE